MAGPRADEVSPRPIHTARPPAPATVTATVTGPGPWPRLPHPVSPPFLLRPLGLCPLRPHPRPAVTDRPPPAPLIGSAVANGTAVAGRAGAARASPHRAALHQLPPPQRSCASAQLGRWACGETAFRRGHFTWSCSLSSARCVHRSALPQNLPGLLVGSGPAQGGNVRGQEGICSGFTVDWQVFPKMRVGLCSSHSPGQEELHDGSRWPRPGLHPAGDRALAPVTPPMLSPAPRAFVRPHLPLGLRRRDALSWRGPGHPPAARRKDRALSLSPQGLTTVLPFCAWGSPVLARPCGASGPSKCWGTEGSRGSFGHL